jgi:hypothetical protein
MEPSNKPTKEEREIFAGYGRKYARGRSGPRLIDLANASADTRGRASVTALLRQFAGRKA